MVKHAYCIIAHNEPDVLKFLVKAIDDDRNDIYILIDKKADIGLFSSISTISSRIYIYNDFKIYWGEESQIQAELALLEHASMTDEYRYYHIISGVDISLKSQDYIHMLCNNCNCQFVGYVNDNDHTQEEIKNRIQYYHFLVRHLKSNHTAVRRFAKIMHDFFLCIQKIFNIKRHLAIVGGGNVTILKKGCNWCSLTNDFVAYLLKYKESILKQFKWTLCADEVFIQTILWNSRYRSSIYNYDSGDEYLMCMREIDWNRGGPYIWRNEDYDYLMNSNKFFARKFSASDLEIVAKLCDSIK